MEPEARSQGVVDRSTFIFRVIRPVEVAQVRFFGFSILSLVFRTRALVLHTVGRRSGRMRATPVAFRREADGSFLIVGGAAGRSRTPDWVANLRAGTGIAAVTVHRKRMDMTVAELRGPERSVAWEDLRRRWPRIDDYRRRSGREVPVFRLVPSAGARAEGPAGGHRPGPLLRSATITASATRSSSTGGPVGGPR